MNGLFVFAPPENNTNLKELNSSIIFPNPFSNILHVNTNLNEAKKIKLYDILGNLITVMNTNENYNALKLDFLTPGVYIVIIENSKIKSEHRIIKY